VRNSHTKENEKEAIRTASECPTGRLTAVDKDGNRYEIACEPAIEVLQDPELGVSGGLFVKGFVRIISSDGRVYESRNRVVLCRCGRSKSMPFCDASHVPTKFSDKR
jgi:hypothetical protein